MSDGLAVGDRMKRYEDVFAGNLPHRIPAIVRIDGRAFHTITRRRFGRAWSAEFAEQMIETATTVMDDMQGCDFCYSQSDEISFLLTDYKTIRTGAWFDYDVAKMISISASLAASVFSRIYGRNVCFDSRAFSLPQDDVVNYFVWRQVDATRNAVSVAAREHYSPKQLQNKNGTEMREMLLQKDICFDDYPKIRQRGFAIVRGGVCREIPIFTEDRDYINRFVDVRED